VDQKLKKIYILDETRHKFRIGNVIRIRFVVLISGAPMTSLDAKM
jgi:hypothetical protein